MTEFDPYAFAERWYEEHPEALEGFLRVERMRGAKMETCPKCKERVSEGQKPHHPQYCLG